jgi:hypothetical protein
MPIDAFVGSTTYRYQAFLATAGGDIWCVWFGHDGQSLMQKLIPPYDAEYQSIISEFQK